MIDLEHDSLEFSFRAVHSDARMSISFQRTLRIPDDNRQYGLPPGLGNFPLRHVDDFAANLTESVIRRGGVMLPMYQSEAMWLSFQSRGGYPFAVKIATGKVSAITGERWDEGLKGSPQNYLVVPQQPWLDGYVVEKGSIRQFVAMPLGNGYTAEEQITGEAVHGGLQILVYPMKRKRWEAIQREQRRASDLRVNASMGPMCSLADAPATYSLGLAPGGRMRQEIYEDEYGPDAWDTTASSRLFVHLTNSMAWRQITGQEPPTVPFTASEYTRAGLPWFEHYAEGTPLSPTATMKKLQGIADLAKKKGEALSIDNQPVYPENIIQLGLKLRPGQVREGSF